MTDAVVITSIISLAVVTVMTLAVCAMVLRASSSRSERGDRLMADLLTKAVNAAVVSESDQVPRIRAEHDEPPLEQPFGVHASVPEVVGSQWETVGEPRNDPMD